MANILNPFGFIYLDLWYYLLAVGLGPVLLWYLSVFRLIENRLHDLYARSGVVTLGLVTHRKVTVYRGSLTRVERRRTHHIRYAYKAPGSDEVYVKDFVEVSRERIRHRFLAVVVLPGRPESGVPKFFVSYPENRAGPARITLGFLVSLGVLAFDVVLFGLLFADRLTGHCVERGDAVYCRVRASDCALGTLAAVALGLLAAFVLHRAQLNNVPGRVWRKWPCDRSTAGAAADSTTGAPSSRRAQRPISSYDNLDDRDIPMAEAVAVLDDDGFQQRVRSDGTIEMAAAYPVGPDSPTESGREAPQAVILTDEQGSDTNRTDQNVPTARVLDMV